MLKKTICFLFLFLTFTNIAHANDATILIINQVRGEEACCNPGSLDLMKRILMNTSVKNLPMGWALRYDALENKRYIDYFQNKQELGILLEITPSLAQTSGVSYRGEKNGSDWYLAKNTFLIGYTPDERKKLIDTLFTAFHSKFGYYPAFSVSWMIDAWSLYYISDVYHIKLHELTKEQYETDSYTLYGGIFNAPYYPSINHPLIPGIGGKKLDVVVVRQTISDLLYNYGSAKAHYTSQPNDYLGGMKPLNTAYFNKLIESALTQTGEINFGLIGLENSIPPIFYDEFIKQLKYISVLIKNEKINVKNPSDYASFFHTKNKTNTPFFQKENFSSGSTEGVLWYYGERYRARVIIKDGSLILDDLRVYADLTDPYKNTPATADYSYWILPYLFDGSQQFSLSDTQKKIIKKNGNFSETIASDFFTSPFGLVLGDEKFSLLEDKSRLTIEFHDTKKNKVTFTPVEILFNKSLNVSFTSPYREKLDNLLLKKTDKTFHFDRQLDFIIHPRDNSLELGWRRDNIFVKLFQMTEINDILHLSPETTIPDIQLLDVVLQPDRATTLLDKDNSIFYWNNKIAIAGRNPIRLFILPLNFWGRPTKIGKIDVKSTSNGKANIVLPKDYSYKIKPWFIDITSPNALRTHISLSIDGQKIINDIPIEFIPNCSDDLKICLSSPTQGIRYIVVLWNEKITNIFESIRNRVNTL